MTVLNAVPYIRWSSGKQAEGSSEERQRRETLDFIAEEGWTLAPESEWLLDGAVSASTGANIKFGNLSIFLKRCALEGGHGLVLVVPEQNRLSRINPGDFMEWFPQQLRTGLTIAFADNGMIVDSGTYRNQRRQIRRIFEDAEESHRYTERLGRLVRAAIREKREKGLPVHNAQTAPAWLSCVYEGRKVVGFERREARIELIIGIFEDYVAGKSATAIARALNTNGVETFRGGRLWHVSTIKRLLRERALIGEYAHKDGEIVADYFPQVVTDELFQAANDPRANKVESQRTQGDKYRDLFSTVTRCAECFERMTLIERRARAGSKGERYLVCNRYFHNREGCSQRRRVRYDLVENLVLSTLLEVALDDVYFQNDADVAALSTKLAGQRRALEDISRSLDSIADVLDRTGMADDERLLARYAKLKQDEKAAKADVEATVAHLKAAKGSATPEQHVLRVSALRKELDHFDPERRLRARKTVKLAMGDLIEALAIKAGQQVVRWPHQTSHRYPEGVPEGLHYVPTERQHGVVRLKGGIRHLHLDFTHREVLADISTEIERLASDPVIVDYRRRMKGQPPTDQSLKKIILMKTAKGQ